MSKTTSNAKDDDQYQGQEQRLVEHLRELHQRLVKILIALALGMVISTPFYERALQILVAPLDRVPQALAPTEGFVVALKVIFVGGVALAMPVILYQLLAFLMPALTKRERRQILFFLPFGVSLFILGLLFGAYIALPAALNWLQSFGGQWVENQYRLTEYISFVTTLLLALGVGFQTPLVVFFTARLGIVSYPTLRKNIRWAFLVAAIVAALLTPTPDPYNMMVVMVPLFFLYLLGVFMARWA
ncbi:MAG: twin-arginine translocase subunit TatC [Anaerolineales bacterium]|nr:twin-arginine translocase subunit TatC [Anaerolineales bacterium]